MAGSWTTLAILDGGGTSRTMRVWDESGAGSGPFSFGGVIGDGSGAANAIGEVQVSPTSNTALDRLKQIQNNSFAKGTPGLPSSDVISSQYVDLRTATTNISALDAGTTSTAGQSGGSILTGTANPGSFASWPVDGAAMARVQVVGTWTGTLSSEGSADGGVTWVAKTSRFAGTLFVGGSITANALLDIDTAGLTHLRLRATAAMTGTAVAQAVISSASTIIEVINALRIVDNTSGSQLVIKPASTAPLATDPAVVVVLSPNSPGLTATSSTGTESNVASSATDVTILASNTARKGASFFNDSGATLYLLNASGTSTTSLYSVQVGPGGFYEMPFGYTGVVKGFWTTAVGNARVTEFT